MKGLSGPALSKLPAEHRSPPHNLEAEQALLGTLMAHPETWAHVGMTLRSEHFFEPVHARIYDVVITLNREGSTVSPLVLKTYFERDDSLQEIGGWEYLVRLTALATVPFHTPDLARLIRDLGQRRQVIEMAGELIEASHDMRPGEGIQPAVAEAVSALSSLVHAGSGEHRTTYTLAEAAIDLVDCVAGIWQGVPDRDAIPTGLASLDALIGGLHRGEYVVLGGRPSMGKTALVVQIAMNVTERGGGVFYASLEMPCRALTPRIISARIWTENRPVPYSRIARGAIDEDEWRWVTSGAKEIETWPLIIDDGPGRSAPEIEALARVARAKLEAKGKTLDLVVVDHLHKMRHSGVASKVQELTEISAGLAEMAKRLHVPVLALAQLNRSVEGREDKRPTLADLRESGSIEQDADAVLLAYREAYYLARNLDSQRPRSIEIEANLMADLEAAHHRFELIIAKQRNGPTDTVRLWCDMPSNVIRDPEDAAELRK
jgi:replicative DNA helicase